MKTVGVEPPVFTTVAALRTHLEGVRRAGRRVAAVPTMGALHEGHASLIRRARAEADEVVVTVFVNPTQFGPNEDFERYPRDLARDTEVAGAAGATAVFAPERTEMYPAGEKTRVRVANLDRHLCGAARPGHFEGVTTVVSKLFNVVGPAAYVFGRKDYQQLRIVERMARDLLFPVEIIEHPTVRERDGLALSSRNAYLSAEDRSRALSIPRGLAAANTAFSAGERSTGILLEMVRGALDRAGLRVDYVELADPECLEVFGEGAQLPDAALLAVAAHAGTTRLIDNMVLGQDVPPAVEADR